LVTEKGRWISRITGVALVFPPGPHRLVVLCLPSLQVTALAPVSVY
jgi:hypothetical protein